MDNFDFTQFISFNSDLLYNEIEKVVKEIFEKAGFSIVAFDNLDKIKKDYYGNYWNDFSFELCKDDFLADYMDWDNKDEIPISISEFVDSINELLKFDIRDLVIIICSSAKSEKSNNLVVNTKQDMLTEELFKMSIHSFQCPDNLVVYITD